MYEILREALWPGEATVDTRSGLSRANRIKAVEYVESCWNDEYYRKVESEYIAHNGDNYGTIVEYFRVNREVLHRPGRIPAQVPRRRGRYPQELRGARPQVRLTPGPELQVSQGRHEDNRILSPPRQRSLPLLPSPPLTMLTRCRSNHE